MRCLTSLFLTLACCVAQANATASAFVWTGDAVTESVSVVDEGGASGSDTPTGMSVLGLCTANTVKCVLDVDVYRDFTVTSPGAFRLISSATNDVQTDDCFPSGCTSPSASVSATFSSSIEITGAKGGSILFSASKSATGPPDYLTPVSLDFSRNSQSVLLLGVGNYVLSENFAGTAVADGDTTMFFDGNFSLITTSTPEPRGSIAFLVAAFVIALLLTTRRRAGLNSPRCSN